MRILAAIATRGRPLRLAGALHSFITLQSGQHQIDYVVRVDQDDTVTNLLIDQFRDAFGIEVLFLPKPISLGEAWNQCAAGRPWDASCVIADKHLCLTQNWDMGVAQLVERDIPAARWHLLRSPEETALILSRKWYDVLGEVFPEFFPFWFSERWVYEVHQLAFGAGIPLITDMAITEPALPTQGIRDLEFWFDFFARSRFARVQQSEMIARAYGKPILPGRAQIIAEMQKADAWQTPRIPMYYEHRGRADGPPPPQYLAAKERATDWLKASTLLHMEVAGAA